jgi:hypothetical protein
MADKPFDTKTFAQFLDEQQAPAETVTVAGYVGRSPRKGAFLLNTGGQTMELPVEAVKSYKVVADGAQKLVELEILGAKIDPGSLVTNPALGAQPFVLATPHNAPASTHGHRGPLVPGGGRRAKGRVSGGRAAQYRPPVSQARTAG